jgi:glutamate-1-semialdehyde 2,1-aminomutase
MVNAVYAAGGVVAMLLLARLSLRRYRLSRAKHPSLQGHAGLSRLIARLVPFYEYGEDDVFRCDGAPPEVAAKRREAFGRLSSELAAKAATTNELSAELEPSVSDMQFTAANRVPFQFRNLVAKNLRVGALAVATAGVKIRDLDGNWSYDLAGSYGVNLLGYEFYKRAIERGVTRVRELGPVLGPYHPVIVDNVRMLREISGLDEVSFHMSGTEAVMQAVRLARFHTDRPKLVLSCGAYHGWWDGVQPGVGHGRKVGDVFMLKDMSAATLRVLRTRDDIACVLVNPLQALHPNAGAGSDAMLVDGGRRAGLEREAYAEWLRELRAVCSERAIVLIFDEVFVGFRLGVGGAQEYFGVRADMVTYGKSVGGGLPVGVVCGRAPLMKRFRDERPADVCFARGTFNSHPYVLGSMNEFLRHVTTPEFEATIGAAEALWNARAAELNARLTDRTLPVRVHNLSSIWVLAYTIAGRYNWMLQYYLRAEGLSLGWVGTGRMIFSHNYTDNDFAEVADRFVRAAEKMQADGWWAQPAADHRAIRRQVLAEVLRRRLHGLSAPGLPVPPRRSRPRAARAASDRSIRPS